MLKYSLIFIAIIALLIAGCSREIENEMLGFEQPDGPPVPINLDVSYLSDSLSLSWEVSDTLSGISFTVYYIDSTEYYADTVNADFNQYGTFTDFSATISGLNSGQAYLLFVASVLNDDYEGSKSDPISVRSGVLTLTINNGDDYTNNRNVNAGFIVPRSASLVKLSENINLTGAIWQIYGSNVNYELSNGDGTKNLYAKIRFSDGSESGIISGTIVLDTKAKIDSVYYNPIGTTFSAGDTVTFYLTTNENDGEAVLSLSGISDLELEYDFLISNPSLSIYTYSYEYVVPSNIEIVDGTITGNFSDKAGNQADSKEGLMVINIANDPTAVSLTAVALSSSSIRLTWSRNSNEDFTAYQIYRSLSTPVSTGIEPIAIITDRNTLAFSDDDLPSELTAYYYRIYVYDNTGRSTGSNTYEVVTLYNEYPTAVELSARVELQDGDSVVVLSWSANDDPDFSSYRVLRHSNQSADPSLWHSLAILGGSATTSFTDHLPDSAESYYMIQVVDKQGKRTGSNIIHINF